MFCTMRCCINSITVGTKTCWSGRIMVWVKMSRRDGQNVQFNSNEMLMSFLIYLYLKILYCFFVIIIVSRCIALFCFFPYFKIIISYFLLCTCFVHNSKIVFFLKKGLKPLHRTIFQSIFYNQSKYSLSVRALLNGRESNL